MIEQEMIQYTQIEGFQLFLNTVDYRALHLHPEWELIWVLEGHLLIDCGQNQYSLAPGEMIFLNPNQPHGLQKAGKNCTLLCLQISPKSFPPSEHFRTDGVYPKEYFSFQEYLWAQNRLLNMMRIYWEQPECYELICTGQVSLLLYLLLNRIPVHRITANETSYQQNRNARLIRLIEFVDQNYMHKIRLSSFAAMENLSLSYLSHFTREMLNQSFQDYVNTVRFHCACRLIAAGNLRMLDVCMESGFSDYRYFSKTFREKVGMTPEAYSRLPQAPLPYRVPVRQSLYSLEHFYTREKSLELLPGFESLYRTV